MVVVIVVIVIIDFLPRRRCRCRRVSARRPALGEAADLGETTDLSGRLERERSTAATSSQSLLWWRRPFAASCALSIGKEGSIGVDDYLFR
jgi:hypothetical protein